MVEIVRKHFNGLIPTPLATDYKGRGTTEGMMSKNGWDRTRGLRNFPVVLEMHGVAQDGGHFRLSPRFVAEMMGFAPDWCDI